MKHVMTWAMPGHIDDQVWADFCRLASTVAACPALLLQDERGAPVSGVEAFGGADTLRSGDLPARIVLRCADSSTPLLIERGRCGSICTRNDVGYLAYGILLAARFVIPGVGLHAMISERDAGFGMALVRDAMAAWNGADAFRSSLSTVFSHLPGQDELARMDVRAQKFAPLRERVFRLLDAVGNGVPEGEFERATLRTADAVLYRLNIGVDSYFDAEYAVESLTGNFRQSVFVLPLPQRKSPVLEEGVPDMGCAR